MDYHWTRRTQVRPYRVTAPRKVAGVKRGDLIPLALWAPTYKWYTDTHAGKTPVHIKY